MRVKKLLPNQGLYIQSPYVYPTRRYHMHVAGYGAGKSSANASAVEEKARILHGHRDREGHRPRILLGGATISHLQKTTLAYVKEDIMNSGDEYDYDSKNNILHIADVDVLVTPLRNPRDIKGYDVWASILDEVDDLGVSLAEDTTFEAMKAINERTRQVIPGLRSPHIMLGSTSQGQLGLYRLYTQFKKTNEGYVKIRGRTKDNPYLPADYYPSLYNIYNENERAVYLEGEFLAISRGQVFGDFNWDRNYLERDMQDEVWPDDVLFWGQDFNQGYHRGCIAVIRNGVIFVVKRYEFPDIREAPKVVRYDFPTQKIFWIPDTTAKEQITHYTRELRRHDIRIVMRGKNPVVEDSAFLVNKLFYTRRLMIARGARETADSVARAQRDERGMIPKGIGPRSPIHDCDALRLIAFFIACNRKEFSDIRHLILDRKLDLMESDGFAVDQMNQGYYAVAN